MTNTVDYLPIANGSGANVETQAQYVIDLASGGSLQNGFESGLMKSVQWNKVIRQSSMIAAAVANFIANELNENVLDDGNLSALTTNLTSAITTAAGVTPVGLVATQVATPYTLQATDGGKFFGPNAAEAFSFTLANVLPIGSRIAIGAPANFATTITIPSGTNLYGGGQQWIGLTTFTIPATSLGLENIILSYTAAGTFVMESVTPATAISLGILGALSLLNVGAGLVSSSGDLAVNRFTSANQTITAGSTLTIAHGLGAVPFAATVDLICLTAQGGFSVGQIVTYYSGYAETAAGTTLGIGIARDATNIYITVPSGEISLFSPSTYDVVTITPANWAIIARAWA